jgi:hypothetical protein
VDFAATISSFNGKPLANAELDAWLDNHYAAEMPGTKLPKTGNKEEKTQRILNYIHSAVPYVAPSASSGGDALVRETLLPDLKQLVWSSDQAALLREIPKLSTRTLQQHILKANKHIVKEEAVEASSCKLKGLDCGVLVLSKKWR